MNPKLLTILVLALCPNILLLKAEIYTGLPYSGYGYSDFGPGMSFTPNAGDTVNGYMPSVSFTPSVDQTLNEIDFVTSLQSSSDVNQVIITLSADSGSNSPGTAIQSQQFDGAMGLLGSTAAIIQWNLSTPEALSANTKYWITLNGPAGVVWNDNNLTSFSLPPQYGYLEFQSASWQYTGNTLGAIDIIGGAVITPEPAAGVLLGLGLVGLGAVRLRAKSR